MAFPPTQIVVTYIVTLPSTTGTITLNIPTGCSVSDFVRAAFVAGGFWTPQNPSQSQPSSLTFIPWHEVTNIVAS